MYRYFKGAINSDYILEWQSRGLSDGSIKSTSAPHNFLNPWISYLGTNPRVIFSEGYLDQDKNYIYSWKNRKHLHCLGDK